MIAAPVPVALTVAAHDPLGGAGIAADLTTFAALGVHGTVAVTAVTAQRLDTVDRVEPMGVDSVAAQLDGLLATFQPEMCKTGFLGRADIVREVGGRVSRRGLPRPVVDPVLVDGRGNPLPGEGLEAAYRDSLFPYAAAITPNLVEASLLAGASIRSPADAQDVAPELAALGAEIVVVTGGAAPGSEAVDVVIFADGSSHMVTGPWIDHHHVRGSGCTFAAALAVGLRTASDPLVAVDQAKRFVTDRLRATRWPNQPLAGPVGHWHDR